MPTNADNLEVSVILPAFNEESAVKTVLREIRSALKSSGLRNSEILVIDDGSTDATAEQAMESDNVRVISHDSNKGYGAALKTGVRHASFQWICITDADGTYPSKRIPDLVSRIRNAGCDMVVGARTGANVKIPLLRRPAKWILSRLADYVTSSRIPDLNSGLRMFRRKTALRFLRLLPDGFSFTTTITLAMLQSGYRVEYVPIDYNKRIGRSKIHPVADFMNFCQLVLRIALYFAPLKFFFPASLFLMSTAIAWALISYFALGQLADVSTIVVAMTSINTLMIGLLAELVNCRVPNKYQEEPEEETQ
jgi:glycosyltransferase involved in cell wall biosynthesis